MSLVKVHLGCGGRVVEGWVNVDYALGARFAKIPLFPLLNRKLKLFQMDWDKRILIHDIRRRFPFEDESVDVIYSSHTLEHFSKEEGHHVLDECRRVLKAKGILRVIVPDLEAFVSKYTSGAILADEFVEKLGVFPPVTSYGFFKKVMTPVIAFPHKCMYDHKTLIEVIKSRGFQVEKRDAFDSDIDDIRSIELEDRTKEAVIVEGRKIPSGYNWGTTSQDLIDYG